MAKRSKQAQCLTGKPFDFSLPYEMLQCSHQAGKFECLRQCQRHLQCTVLMLTAAPARICWDRDLFTPVFYLPP